jgi:hypothetical protein
VQQLSRQVLRARIRTVLTVAVLGLLAFAVAGRGGGGSGSAAASKCRGLAHLAEAAQKFSTFLTGSNPDPETFVEEFHDFAVFRFLNLVGGAPDEIRDDINVLDDAFQKYVDAVADLDLPPGNLDQKALEKLDQKALEKLDQKALEKLDQKALEKLDQEAQLDQKALEKLQHPSIEIDRKRVVQASQNISAWVQRAQKNCT